MQGGGRGDATPTAKIVAKETVIREDDAGDRYYVVASGSVDVSRAGVHVDTRSRRGVR
jgi:CRP-like cAMP-binding protein